MYTLLATILIYAITGGPGTGKTSIIERLRTKNEVVAQEAATKLIQEWQDDGVAHPWEHPDFNFYISLLQENIENSAITDASKQNKHRIFVDRGVLDPLVYEETDFNNNPIQVSQLERYHRLKNRVSKLIDDRYDVVFFVLPHSSKPSFTIQTTAVRKEDTSEAMRLADQVLGMYKRFVPEEKIVYVPGDMAPDQRAEFILSYLNKLQQQSEELPIIVKSD